NGVGFLDEARGFAGEIVAVKPGELKGILQVVNRHAHERFASLAHQAGVGPKDKHDRPIGAGEEAIDLGDFQWEHGPAIARTYFLMPAHSASKTRMNALMLGIPSTAASEPLSGALSRGRGLCSTEEGAEKLLCPGDKIGGKPRPDIVGDHFRR